MDGKCSNGHPMLKGKPHCGECGAGPAASGGDGGKCAACSAAFTKSFKFCPDCGADQAAGPDLDAAIAELDAFAKARVAIEADFATLPEVDEATIDDGKVDEIIAKARVRNDAGEDVGLDADVVMEAFMKSVNRLNAESRANFNHVVSFLGHLGKSEGAMMKAVLAMAGRIRELEGKVDTLAKASRGRKVDLTLLTPGATRGPAPAEPADDFPDVQATDLIAKAVVATQRDPQLLDSVEMSQLSMLTGRGASLKAVMEFDPRLGARVKRAIEATVTQH